ncbi:hypothetical protein PHK61_11680 [Actinomycetospora lutea]|uniref:hypothetical protein n=1 Tax=Actinomycetospora lutea TaxID=663604 RepID=UPI0023659135|nr:hypothetical protein [Actinomycetospora lutea]MDD7939075.1 hypothetical protein [Actinomycetospora lutea]
MADTPIDARARDGHDESADRVEVHLDDTYDDAVLRVFRTAQWIPPAYRQAYLDGAARVLGRAPLTLES